MNMTNSDAAPSDALVLFGVTGDLAHKMIFPALYAMAKRGALNVPVVGVASSKWSLAQLRKRAEDSIRKSGKIDDQARAAPSAFRCFAMSTATTTTRAPSTR